VSWIAGIRPQAAWAALSPLGTVLQIHLYISILKSKDKKVSWAWFVFSFAFCKYNRLHSHLTLFKKKKTM
jgi:hypothetical protein